ncbi:LysR family transcriptional regulator [Duganella vulcania]|uniref:LysR family transcriptional regulator n=1 Tax=Duganella vulcania TaxID=2692166 RepID=A0A845GK31_9BURK|nr:LysR family transcriptional regulator [Duganella vulcania]MYM94331.1 LysR family transcriptional regulator [Duganella vulcania]
MSLLSSMELFVAVANAKGFRRAAETLDMPNSTLSRRISELEKEIGVRLFHRSTRKVELTEAGQAYFRRCESIVAEARLAHESLQELAERPTGTLRVSMPVDLAITYLAPSLKAFSAQYPQIDFEMDLTSRRVDLVTDGFDCAIRIGTPPPTPSTLIARQVGLLPRYLFASPEYLRGAAPLNHPDDLVNHQCIIPFPVGGKAQWTLSSRKKTVTIEVGGRYATNNVGMCRKLASLGLGVAISAGPEAAGALERDQLQRVLPEWDFAPVPVYAIIESRLIPSRVRLFIDFVQASLRGYSAPL